MNVFESIRADLEGAKLLADWLGDGGVPVHPIKAELRARACTEGNNGQPCPLNTAPDWWDRVKSTIADWIRSELELKNRLELSTHHDPKLHMCSACGCCLKLKIWCPPERLRQVINQPMLEKTPSYCWMRKEIPHA